MMNKKDLIIVIFGSTGDLTYRKLIPAIEKLNNEDLITKNFQLLAIGRRDFNNEDYYKHVLESNPNLKLDNISKYTNYYKMQITDNNDYAGLKKYLDNISHDKTRIIYYLAVAPHFFIPIANNISENKLLEKGNLNHSLIFEKPFGSDLESAKMINRKLWKIVEEKQIYRIDHYLAKEMIQNIMIVRFANKIFEDVWNNKSIKSIRIYAKELVGILGRASFYDNSGALKDMVQSHLLQVLSLVAMDPPKSIGSNDVKDAKVEVLKALKFDEEAILLGQYKGYLEEENIPKDSKTETFVFLKTFVDTKRFKGVPIYLLTGKKLDKKSSKIIIEFHETDEQKSWGFNTETNKLYIEFAPSDSVNIFLNSKIPGLTNEAKSINLSYSNELDGNDGYEKLLLDAINFHQTLFTRWDEIEYSWKFIDQVKKLNKDVFIYDNYEEVVEEIKKIVK